MTDEQRAIYGGVISVRNADVALRWSISQIFFVVHSAALTLIATQLRFGTRPFTFGCVASWGLCLLWLMIVVRMGNLINYWNMKLGDLEDADGQLIRVFSDAFIRFRPRLTTGGVLTILIGGLVLGWALAGIGSFLRE